MNQHYYSENPESELKEKVFQYTIKGRTLELASVSGVFAFEDKADRASELLIENFIPSGSNILDMGCGYGAIGLFLKALFPNQTITMTDINNRAVEYTKKNAVRNRLDANVVQGDLYSAVPGTFDDIVTNPPIAAGRKLNTLLISDAAVHLSPGGALWLVAYHNKGGETLRNIMKDTFGNATDVEKSGGIRVYKAIK